MFSEEPERPTKRKKFDESNNHNSSGFQKASLVNNGNNERPNGESDSRVFSINNVINDNKLARESEVERKQRLEIEALKRQLEESRNSSFW